MGHQHNRTKNVVSRIDCLAHRVFVRRYMPVADLQKASEECQADVSAECKTFFESGAECGPIPQKAEDCSCSLDLQNCILGKLTCETEAPAPAPTFNGTAPANPCLDNCLKVCSSAQCGDASVVGVSAVAIVAAVAARFF